MKAARRWTGGDALRKTALAVLCGGALASCMTHNGPTFYDDPTAMAVLSATPASQAHGVVTFIRVKGGTRVNANLSGLKPYSTHGIHIHERGDCAARDASSAGEHFNPSSSRHGAPYGGEHHAGDLGNVTADGKGEVYSSFQIDDGAFGSGDDSIIGRGVVVHADKDDLNSQPAGNSGARIACGSIIRNPDRTTYAQATTR